MTVKLIPGQGMYANAYLAGGTILVDAGVTPMDIEAHKDKITHIILTHCHYDHTAYLPELVRITGAKVCIHNADVKGLNNDSVSLSMLFGSHSTGIVPDIVLNGGEIMEGFEVISTPGHTPGSICLYDKENCDLISGDTVFTDGAFGRYDFPGGDLKSLTASLEHLAGIKVNGLYPGHGIPVRNNGERHIRAANILIHS